MSYACRHYRRAARARPADAGPRTRPRTTVGGVMSPEQRGRSVRHMFHCRHARRPDRCVRPSHTARRRQSMRDGATDAACTASPNCGSFEATVRVPRNLRRAGSAVKVRTIGLDRTKRENRAHSRADANDAEADGSDMKAYMDHPEGRTAHSTEIHSARKGERRRRPARPATPRRGTRRLRGLRGLAHASNRTR